MANDPYATHPLSHEEEHTLKKRLLTDKKWKGERILLVVCEACACRDGQEKPSFKA